MYRGTKSYFAGLFILHCRSATVLRHSINQKAHATCLFCRLSPPSLYGNRHLTSRTRTNARHLRPSQRHGQHGPERQHGRHGQPKQPFSAGLLANWRSRYHRYYGSQQGENRQFRQLCVTPIASWSGIYGHKQRILPLWLLPNWRNGLSAQLQPTNILRSFGDDAIFRGRRKLFDDVFLIFWMGKKQVYPPFNAFVCIKGCVDRWSILSKESRASNSSPSAMWALGYASAFLVEAGLHFHQAGVTPWAKLSISNTILQISWKSQFLR